MATKLIIGGLKPYQKEIIKMVQKTEEIPGGALVEETMKEFVADGNIVPEIHKRVDGELKMCCNCKHANPCNIRLHIMCSKLRIIPNSDRTGCKFHEER